MKKTTILLAALTLTSTTLATDWPTWRGPDHDGQSKEKNLDLDWPESGPPLLWQSEGCGRGYASVAVSDGTIYTIGRRDDAEHLIAFDEKSGDEKWATPFGK